MTAGRQAALITYYGFLSIFPFALLYLVGQALVYAAEVAAVRYARLWPRALDVNRPTAADARALALLAREQERIPASSSASQRVAPHRYRVIPRQPMPVQADTATPAASRTCHRRSGGRALDTAQPDQSRRGQAHHRDKASDRCPYRLAGAQNSQIWIARVLISIVPTSVQNEADLVRHAHRRLVTDVIGRSSRLRGAGAAPGSARRVPALLRGDRSPASMGPFGLPHARSLGLWCRYEGPQVLRRLLLEAGAARSVQS